MQIEVKIDNHTITVIEAEQIEVSAGMLHLKKNELTVLVAKEWIYAKRLDNSNNKEK